MFGICQGAEETIPSDDLGGSNSQNRLFIRLRTKGSFGKTVETKAQCRTNQITEESIVKE